MMNAQTSWKAVDRIAAIEASSDQLVQEANTQKVLLKS